MLPVLPLEWPRGPRWRSASLEEPDLPVSGRSLQRWLRFFPSDKVLLCLRLDSMTQGCILWRSTNHLDFFHRSIATRNVNHTKKILNISKKSFNKYHPPGDCHLLVLLRFVSADDPDNYAGGSWRDSGRAVHWLSRLGVGHRVIITTPQKESSCQRN